VLVNNLRRTRSLARVPYGKVAVRTIAQNTAAANPNATADRQPERLRPRKPNAGTLPKEAESDVVIGNRQEKEWWRDVAGDLRRVGYPAEDRGRFRLTTSCRSPNEAEP